jgi:hypothetical protein
VTEILSGSHVGRCFHRRRPLSTSYSRHLCVHWGESTHIRDCLDRQAGLQDASEDAKTFFQRGNGPDFMSRLQGYATLAMVDAGPKMAYGYMKTVVNRYN